MKISYSWLCDYLKTDESLDEIIRLLTEIGLEVEGTEEFESIPGGLKGVYVGKVLTCEQHPNADRLKVCTVDIGIDEPLQIVCGANNVAIDQLVPVATVGTSLKPTGADEAFTIKKGKLRGEVSMGMIRAEDELGLGDDHDGIMVLDDRAEIGQSAADYFGITRDTVIEIGLTPNRADSMSHYGVARDLRAALLRFGKKAELHFPHNDVLTGHHDNAPISVEVRDTSRAPRYAGIVLENIKVGPSPEWLKNRLKAIGLAPINNVVDITNYVNHELGQPLHAFDASKIRGQKVIVDTMTGGSKFTTLDEKERELHQNDLMICDAEGGMCIAGVFGGIESGVSDETTSIFLESAYFDPVSVRKTARRHGLNTDASFRFERGIDPNGVVEALKRAVVLLEELAGATIASDLTDLYHHRIPNHHVDLKLEYMDRLIGEEINRPLVRNILEWLDIKIVNEEEEGWWALEVPAYRVDVTRPADVVEEILRIYGFNELAEGGKMVMSTGHFEHPDVHRAEELISEMLCATGFHQMMANSLTSAEYGTEELYDLGENTHPVKMINPLSSEQAVMRRSLIPGALDAIAHNIKRQRRSLALFEFGRAYFEDIGDFYREEEYLLLALSGPRGEEHWTTGKAESSFYQLKSAVSKVLKRLGLGQDFVMKPAEHPYYSEGLEVIVRGSRMGFVGLVRQDLIAKADVEQAVYAGELRWDLVKPLLSSTRVRFEELPKFPFVRRDLALLVNKNVAFGDIQIAAEQTERKLLQGVELFDVYEGKNLPAGKKSYAVSFTFYDDKKTLTDKVVDKAMSKIQSAVEKSTGAELRG